jgi:hypothetical protein
VFAYIGGETGSQHSFHIRVELGVTEHLLYRANRFNERAADRAEVPALPLDGDHAGHMTEDVGEETDVEPPLGQVECLVTQFVKGQIFKWRGHGNRLVEHRKSLYFSGSRATHMDSSHSADTTSSTEPNAAKNAATMADHPAGVAEFTINASATPK